LSKDVGARPKILIAESFKEVRDALESALGATFDTLPSGTVNGTLLGFQRHRPAAVIISMKQSEGHGLDLCSRLRAVQTSPPPFIVVYGTVPDLPEDVLEGDIRARYGPDRYIPRGVTLKKLTAVLEEQARSHWRPSDPGPGADDLDPPSSEDPSAPPRWSHPMTSTDVVSAKNPATESGIFRRFWKKD
jgi:DNA-binding response OmpR family regulator